MMSNSSGAIATSQGSKWEQNIAAQLTAHQIEYETSPTLKGHALWDDGDLTPDFLVHNLRQFPAGLFLEAKWQDSRGSAFEKIPYSIMCIKECYPLPGAIVVGGSRMQRVVAWATRQVDNKFVGIWDEATFTRFLMRSGL